MGILSSVNWITVFIIVIFALPILSGFLFPLLQHDIRGSMWSILNSLEMILALILAILLNRVILSYNGGAIVSRIYSAVPALRNFSISIVLIILLTVIIDGLLHLLANPIYKRFLIPLSQRYSTAFGEMSGAAKRIISGIWQLPKSICIVLVFSVILSFYPTINAVPAFSEYINNSAVYRLVDNTVISPLFNSVIAKQLPVILKDSFRSVQGGNTAARNNLVVTYFNGMPLGEAIKSNDDIDAAARKIIGSETGNKEKANLIYKWITKNIRYDSNKVTAVMKDPSKVSSGAVVAFKTRQGVCFDFACLYVAMCRAVNVKVRFISGSAYNGHVWGDHAWNQIYSPGEDRWINVDPTFGITGLNYFDRPDFGADHDAAEIDGEW